MAGYCHLLCYATRKKRKKSMAMLLSLPFSFCYNKRKKANEVKKVMVVMLPLPSFLCYKKKKEGDNNVVAVAFFTP